MSNQPKTAIVGLGSMGFGMAQSLLKANHHTYGYDILPAKMQAFQELGGAVGELTEIAPSLDTLVVAVLNAEQTEAVLFGANGAAEHLKPGTIVLGCATVPPEFARGMEARCSELDLLYLDAPISGGSLKAANGQLSIMASGSQEAFAKARPALDAMAETVFELGDSAGAGSAMKAVNQLLAGVHIATMAEALTFGITQGVAPTDFVNVISKCVGTSWMLENRAPHIVDGDYTPHSTVNIWPKDLGIVLDIAKASEFDAPITTAALAQFMAAAKMGLGDEDDAAVAKVYAQNSGLTLPKKDQS